MHLHKFYQSISIKLATFYSVNVAAKVKTLETYQTSMSPGALRHQIAN